MTLPHKGNEAESAEWMQVTVDQLERWRADGIGPDYTSLRNGQAYYSQRDMRIYLREQMEKRKAEQETGF